MLKTNKLAFHQRLAALHSGMLIGKLSNALCSLLCLTSGISVASGVSMTIDLTAFYISSVNWQFSCHALSLTPLSFARMRYNSQSIRQALIYRCFVKIMVKLLLRDPLKPDNLCQKRLPFPVSHGQSVRGATPRRIPVVSNLHEQMNLIS